MAQKRLRAVSPGERHASKPKTVAEAAESEDHRALLVAMRDRIAKAVSNPECPPRDLAALTRRLQEIARELESIDARDGEVGERGESIPDGEFDASAL